MTPRNIAKAIILIWVSAVITGCAKETVKIAPALPQPETNWTWAMLEAATETTDITRAYNRFNTEKRDPALAAEAYAGIAFIALFSPTVMDIQLREGKQQALLFSQKAILADPASPKAQYSRGLALSATNKYEEAEKFLAELAPRASKTCDYQILATDIAIRKNGLLQAFYQIKKALDCKPGRHASYLLNFAAARAASQAGDYAQSRAYYSAAISIKRDDPVLYIDYAKMLMAAANLPEALQMAQKADSLQKSANTQELISAIHIKTAEKYHEEAKYQLAERQYRLAIAYDVNNTDAYRALMALYADNLKMCQEALTCAEIVLERQPDDKNARQIREKCGGS